MQGDYFKNLLVVIHSFSQTNHFQEMRKFILINLNKRFSPPMIEKWQPTDAEAVRAMATILDPRYKDSTSANGDHTWRKINMYEVSIFI